jgi:hypothetical protein
MLIERRLEHHLTSGCVIAAVISDRDLVEKNPRMLQTGF